jgi:hypothetical protein
MVCKTMASMPATNGVHTAAYLKKGELAHKKGISNTEAIIEIVKGGSEAKLSKKDAKDRWGWDKTLKAYKKQDGTGADGGKLEVTSMLLRE